MKRLLTWFLFTGTLIPASGQRYLDSLHEALRTASSDTGRALTLCLIAQYHEYVGKDSNAYYVQRADELSKKVNFPLGRFLAHRSLFYAAIFRSDYPKAIQIAYDNLRYGEDMDRHRLYYLALNQHSISLASRLMGDTIRWRLHARIYDSLWTASGYEDADIATGYFDRSNAFFTSDPQKFIAMRKKAFELNKISHGAVYIGLNAAGLAEGYLKIGNDSLARLYYQEGIRYSEYYNNTYFLTRLNLNLAEFFEMRNPDSSLYFARRAIEYSQTYEFGDYASRAARILAGIYKTRHQPDSTVKYMEEMIAAKDSIFSQNKLREFQKQVTDYDLKQREDQQQKERYQARVRLYASIASLIVFLILSVILYGNNRRKQRANKLLSEQKAKIESTLKELNTTQSQLIQSEKMASLGELTAGIAHEIQNPLNFVNNFSELNEELLREMKDEMKKGNLVEADSIADRLTENEIKIKHHGKRADAIVKGMLQHSRASAGQKEPTDINSMADEYLRLSYHGYRAKNNEFKVELNTRFDPSTEKINIVRQDIGRALLNIYNNAFYAVFEKYKFGANHFEPSVTVSTNRLTDAIEIRVRDNGIGVPEKIKDKIFQPFFTSKPTGSGTGLGLSMSYDIIKAQGGELSLNNKVADGAEFIIQIPIS